MSRHRVALLVLPGVLPLDLAIPAQIFGPRPDTPYALTLCGPNESVTWAGSAVRIGVDCGLDAVARADTVVVAGYDPPTRRLDDDVVDALRRAGSKGRRLVSICTGAFALAAAGVLDDRKATTHWQYLAEFAASFPAVSVESDALYVDEGDVLTSAGVCCGIDLCLHVIRKDLGATVANDIARSLVAAPHRHGGQKQFVPALVPANVGEGLASTRAWALAHLDRPLTINELARHASLSSRTFIRHFTSETGTTPLQWLLTARIGAARQLLEKSDTPIDEIARVTGLGTAANLRLHLRRSLDTTPSAYRTTFRARPASDRAD